MVHDDRCGPSRAGGPHGGGCLAPPAARPGLDGPLRTALQHAQASGIVVRQGCAPHLRKRHRAERQSSSMTPWVHPRSEVLDLVNARRSDSLSGFTRSGLVRVFGGIPTMTSPWDEAGRYTSRIPRTRIRPQPDHPRPRPPHLDRPAGTLAEPPSGADSGRRFTAERMDRFEAPAEFEAGPLRHSRVRRRTW